MNAQHHTAGDHCARRTAPNNLRKVALSLEKREAIRRTWDALIAADCYAFVTPKTLAKHLSFTMSLRTLA